MSVGRAGGWVGQAASRGGRAGRAGGVKKSRRQTSHEAEPMAAQNQPRGFDPSVVYDVPASDSDSDMD